MTAIFVIFLLLIFILLCVLRRDRERYMIGHLQAGGVAGPMPSVGSAYYNFLEGDSSVEGYAPPNCPYGCPAACPYGCQKGQCQVNCPHFSKDDTLEAQAMISGCASAY